MPLADDAPGRLRRERLRFWLLLGAALPFFLAAEAAQRSLARLRSDGEAAARAQKPIVEAARENAGIAISYAFMARTALQSFARQNRTERQS